MSDAIEPTSPADDPAYAGALEALERGVAVFPIVAGGKMPLTLNGLRDASKDRAVVEAWRDAHPGCNWAAVPATGGMFVADQDVKHGQNGPQRLQEAAAANGGLPATFTVETPSGGLHHWFHGQAPTRQSMLPGIDIRGGRSDGSSYGYVLLPGSMVDGKRYTIRDDSPVAPAPEWLLTLAQTPREQSSVTDDEIDALAGGLFGCGPLDYADVPHDLKVRLARELRDRPNLKARWDGSTEGLKDRTRSGVEFSLAAMLSGPFEAEEVGTLIRANPHTKAGSDGETSRELARTILRSGCTQDLGANGDRAAEMSAEYMRRQGLEPEREPSGSDNAKPDKKPAWLQFHGASERAALRPSEFVVDKLIPENFVFAVYAKPGSYKSFVMLDLAFAIAAGRPAFGAYAVLKPGPTIYFCGEGYIDFVKQRVAALFADAGLKDNGSVPLLTVPGVPPANDPAAVAAVIKGIRRQLRGEKPALIVIDTLARSMPGINTNEAQNATVYMEMVQTLADELGCCVGTVGHEGKTEGKGFTGAIQFEAGFQGVIRADADKASLTTELLFEKDKDGEADRVIYLGGEKVWLPDTARGSSLVFKELSQAEYLARKADKGKAQADKRFHDLCVKLAVEKCGEGQPIKTNKPIDKDGVAWAAFTRARNGADVKDAAIRAELTKAVEAGVLVIRSHVRGEPTAGFWPVGPTPEAAPTEPATPAAPERPTEPATQTTEPVLPMVVLKDVCMATTARLGGGPSAARQVKEVLRQFIPVSREAFKTTYTGTIKDIPADRRQEFCDALAALRPEVDDLADLLDPVTC